MSKYSIIYYLTSFFCFFYEALCSQDYNQQKKDSIKNEIVNYFNKNKTEIDYYILNGTKKTSVGIPDIYKDVALPYYASLKKLDAVYSIDDNLVFLFKRGRKVEISLKSGPVFFNEGKCIIYWVPPAGHGYSLSGVLWENMYLMGFREFNGINFWDIYNVYSKLDKKIQEQKLYASYWNNFEQIIKQYDKSIINSELTEEQRKFVVLANAANEDKNYTDALEFYSKLIRINPVSYPTAYFNMALIAAQKKDYTLAIVNMKKYLLLVPNAEDSRKGKDKIYEWEYKLDK